MWREGEAAMIRKGFFVVLTLAAGASDTVSTLTFQRAIMVKYDYDVLAHSWFLRGGTPL
jgi:hypothetical protein